MMDLQQHCEQLGIPFEPAWSPKMTVHLRLLERWSQKINLISRSDPTAPLVRHLVDSLTLLKLDAVWSAIGRAADLGSGGGFPGLPLAIARPDMDWSLIEPRQKRGAFLNQVIAAADVHNAHWVESRLPDPDLEPFALVVSRATFPPDRLLPMALPLLQSHGVLALMASVQPRLDLGVQWQLVESFEFRLADAPRWIGALQRTA